MFGAPSDEQVCAENEKHEFKSYAENWFNVFSRPNIDTSTAVNYAQQLRVHIYPALEGKSIESIVPADVQEIFNNIKGSKATKQKVKTVLNMIFEQALEDGIIGRNPLKSRSIRIKGTASVTTPTYTVEQMQYLAGHIGDIVQPYDRNYIALQALHPFRLEEILGLRWEDIDFDKGVIHIRNTVTHPKRNQPVFAEKTKTDQSRRTIALVTQIIPYLTVEGPEDFVIGGKTPFSYQQVKRMCDRIEKDIEFDEPITPRRFRTTVLTDLYDSTKDIKLAQAAAGHTTAAMTLKHYVKGRNSTASTAAPVANLYGLT